MDKTLLPKIEAYLQQNRQNIVEDLKTLVSIPSVSVGQGGDHPFGDDCARVLDKAIEMARGKGLEATNHGYYYGTVCSGEGDKTIGIFSHLDVVPEGNDWIYKPYEPVEKDGYLIGRGVADNKGAAVAGFYIMDCLRTLGLPMKSRISLFLGCNEEVGMGDIERYVAEQPMPDFSIVPDTDFPVCHGEKGIIELDYRAEAAFKSLTAFSGGLASNMVPDRATATLTCGKDTAEAIAKLAAETSGIAAKYADGAVTFTATGVSSHAAHPDGSLNAVGLLAGFLCHCPGVHPDDCRLMEIAEKAMSTTDGSSLSIACSDEPSGALTCISGKAATVDGCLELNFNIRYPVTKNGDEVIEGMRSHFSKLGWHETGVVNSGPAYLPKDDPKVQQLCHIYEELTGKDATPYVMGGGTYVRRLRNAVGFGMESDNQAGWLPSGHGGVHQPDEAMKIDDMLEAIKIYVMSMVEIDAILH